MKGRSIARHYLKPSNAIADTGLPVRTSLRLAPNHSPLEGESRSLRGFSYPPQIIPPLISPQTSLQTLEYHSPLEGESQKPEPNGEGFCGGGSAQGEPTARSCAPSRVSTGQPTGEGRCGGGNRAGATCPLLNLTYGTPRWPPSGSTAGGALVSPTPPQGGSDT